MMASLRSATVNLCPDDAALWQGEGEGRFVAPGPQPGSPFALALTGAGQLKSVPRYVEPSREYELECEVKGRGRIGLVWVREGRPRAGAEQAAAELPPVWTSPTDGPRFAQLAEMGAVWSEPFATEGPLRIVLRGTSPRTANRVQVVLVGEEGETWFDAPYLDGLGAARVEVTVPAGYLPRSSKVAMVAARETVAGGRFEVLAGERVVLAGELARWGEYLWGREYWQADFSALQTAGAYRLRITLADGRVEMSPEFTVDPDLYLSLSNKTLGWYYTQRCGMEVPGWHPACHLDDAVIGRSHERYLGPGGKSWDITGAADLTGGWHDAGDNHKYICWSYLALWGMARLQSVTREDRRMLGEALPDALAEAAWEARFLLKTISPEGLFPLGVVSRIGWVNGPLHQETDNVRDSGDERGLPDARERICDIPTYGPELTSALIASSLADLGLALRGREEDLARRCLDAACLTWDKHHRATPPPAEHLRWHAAFALLDASLLRAMTEDDLRADLEFRVRQILAQQKPEGIFPFPKGCDDYRAQVLEVAREQRATLPYLSPTMAPYAISHEACGVDYIPNPFLYLHALLEYLELFPETSQAPVVRRALGRTMDFAEGLCAKTPYGQMMEWTFAPDPVNFVHMFHGYNCALLSLAVVAARASRELKRPELLALAERQLQWVLGRNPRGTSLMAGVGAKQLGLYHTGLSWYPEHRTGEQPGGVVNGFVAMSGTRIGYYGPSYPWDFPYLDVRAPEEEAGWLGVDADWWCNETWVPNCSWFLMAAVALHRALQ
jgi:hypothetical protein